MYLEWRDYYEEAKKGLVTKIASSMTISLFAVNVKRKYEKRHLSLYLENINFPFLYRSKVSLCHSRDTNETFYNSF